MPLKIELTETSDPTEIASSTAALKRRWVSGGGIVKCPFTAMRIVEEADTLFFYKYHVYTSDFPHIKNMLRK